MAKSRPRRRKSESSVAPAGLPPVAIAIALAAAMLVAFTLLVIGNIDATSPTVDETTHLAAGWSYRALGDYRLNAEHPPLLKRIAALAVGDPWPHRLEATADGDAQARHSLLEAWSMALANPMAEWWFAHHLLYSVRDSAVSRGAQPAAVFAPADFLNDSAVLFRRARLVMMCWGILLGVLIFCWSSELWGVWGGVCSLLFYAFDPNFLAHSGLVTTDVGVAALFFGAIYFFWRICRRFSIANTAAFALFFALAQTAKFSALLLVPIVLMLAIHRWLSREPWIGEKKLPSIESRARRAVAMAAIIAIAVVVAWAAIWAAYGFHFTAAPDPEAAALEENMARTSLTQPALNAPAVSPPGHLPLLKVVEEWAAREQLLPAYPEGAPDAEVHKAQDTTRIGWMGGVLLAANRLHIVPEAYLAGFALLESSSLVRHSFLRGEYSGRGFADYFFWTLLYKTTIPALAAIVASLLMVVMRRERRKVLAFLLWPVAIYLGFSVASSLNIGHRHILPIYPFLYVICGALAASWERMMPRIRFAVAVAAMVIVPLSATVVFAPITSPAPMWGRHLSYVNEIAGGPGDGFESLADSNFDWGQDLPRLRAWIDQHHVSEPINLVYFGTADPRAYGIRHLNLQLGYFAEPELPQREVRIPGYFAISATHFVGATVNPDSRRYWRTYLELHGAKLVGRAGYSILIFRIDR
ncbi:MAG TPA: hypothetical protein VEZ11_10910 [Thermoanaerobaculia bacterium]|nr:hypothetical protein [Thermoanaerobaculia bacterium]